MILNSHRRKIIIGGFHPAFSAFTLRYRPRFIIPTPITKQKSITINPINKTIIFLPSLAFIILQLSDKFNLQCSIIVRTLVKTVKSRSWLSRLHHSARNSIFVLSIFRFFEEKQIIIRCIIQTCPQKTLHMADWL